MIQLFVTLEISFVVSEYCFMIFLNFRLLWASGSETILATYMVGIYVNKELIGQCKY